MDIPEEDPNKSNEGSPEQQVPELPVDDPASNTEEDGNDVGQAALQLLHLEIRSGTEDRTPTDPGTGQPLFNEPPPILRIKELRREILTSPPVNRRSSRKLDFPPKVNTPENSPVMSPEVNPDKPYTFGKELYVSLPGSSAEVLKQRTSPTTAPENPFLLRLMGRRSQGQSAQSPNLGLGGSPSQGQSAHSLNLGLGGSNSQGQSAQTPNIGLGGIHSQGQSPSNPNLRLINTAAQGYMRNIMSDAIPESLSLSSNVVIQPPAVQQSKRSLEKSPSESGPSGSPSVVKRHRRAPTAPEGRPAADVQLRRRLSYEARGSEPEGRREQRKRSSSEVEKTENEERKKKGKRKAGDGDEERLI